MAAKKQQQRGRSAAGFTPEERAAMKERAKELKAAAGRRRAGAPDDAEPEVLARIAAMPEADRVLARRFHGLVRATAPGLAPRLWYGMPAYARDGKVVCFFQDAAKFKARYATVGFTGEARLDEGLLWPTSYALAGLTAAEEGRLVELLRRAVGGRT